jgi:hypothetical protein
VGYRTAFRRLGVSRRAMSWSTPKALQLYGVSADAYADETEIFDRIHEMRAASRCACVRGQTRPGRARSTEGSTSWAVGRAAFG